MPAFRSRRHFGRRKRDVKAGQSPVTLKV